MSRPSISFWQANPDKLPVLLILREKAELSASGIGRQLGCSRNTVIGKLARLGLPSLFLGAHTRTDGRLNFHDKPAKPRPLTRAYHLRVDGPKPPINHKVREGGNSNLSAPKLPKTDIRLARPVSKSCKGKPIYKLKEKQCKFGIGYDKKGTHLFCSQPTDGGSWCPGHAARVYIGARK